ncbi:MAG: hypothetical protein Salg2KO_15790 [Salibacteraceae bacterium]
MRKVLNDPALEAQFQKEGFVKIPFMDAEKAARLKQAFFDSLPESGGHIQPQDESFDTKALITYDFTFIDKNIEYKKKVFDIIRSELEPSVKKFLADYEPIIANFIRKEEHGGEVPLHQNWAFVDEDKCTSVSIWCPLVESTKENGTLQVVPGSHKRFGRHRGPMIRWELEDIKEDIISEHLVPIEASPGEAVILDDSIVHYSAINKTPGLRLTIQLILIPREFPSLHYHLDHRAKDKQVQVYEVDHEFYMAFNPWKKPSNVIKALESYPYIERNTDLKSFRKKLYGPRFDSPQKAGLFTGILNILKRA